MNRNKYPAFDELRCWHASVSLLEDNGIGDFDGLLALEMPPNRMLRGFGKKRWFSLAKEMIRLGVAFPERWRSDPDVQMAIKNCVWDDDEIPMLPACMLADDFDEYEIEEESLMLPEAAPKCYEWRFSETDLNQVYMDLQQRRDSRGVPFEMPGWFWELDRITRDHLDKWRAERCSKRKAECGHWTAPWLSECLSCGNARRERIYGGAQR